MRLYLSSYKFGNSPENLASLALDNRRAAIVMNAVDVFGPERRPQHVEANRTQLCSALPIRSPGVSHHRKGRAVLQGPQDAV